jgi:hypothetical protein
MLISTWSPGAAFTSSIQSGYIILSLPAGRPLGAAVTLQFSPKEAQHLLQTLQTAIQILQSQSDEVPF